MADMKFKTEYRTDYQRLREVMLGHKNKSILNDDPEPKPSSDSIRKDLKKGMQDLVSKS